MITPAQLAAARHFAPPLFGVEQVDRRGAKLRTVNRRAVDYARAAGLPLAAVYPGALGAVQAMAPAPGSPEAAAWLAATGVPPCDAYPALSFGGEAAPAPRWGWAVAGAVAGALFGGPVWAAVGGLLGGLR